MLKTSSMVYKLLVIGVIVLFIAVTFSPTLYANNLIGRKLVEFNIEFCGLSMKHTVQLSQIEALEVNGIFESVGEQLYTVDSRWEAEEIFKEAVVKLHPYGLFGKLNIEQSQRLVIGDSPLEKIKRGSKKSNDSDYINKYCLIYLSDEKTKPGDQHILLLNFPRWLLNFMILPWIPLNLLFFTFLCHIVFPFAFRGFVWISGYNFNLKSFGLKGYVDTFIGPDVFLSYFIGLKYQYGYSNGGSPSFAFDNASLFGYARKVNYGSW